MAPRNQAVDARSPAGDRPRQPAYVGQRVRVPKTAELVAAHLRRRIVRGELAEGDTLPPEATLMAQFDVSRPTLREAFRILESEALISVRRGAHGGARVHVPNGEVAARYAALVLEHRGTTLADLLAARTIVEPPCVGILAANRTEEDLAALRLAVADAELSLDEPTRFIRVNVGFHALLVDMAGNQTLSVLNGMLSHIIDLANYSHVAEDAGTATNRRANRKGLSAHQHVVALIAERRGAEAQRPKLSGASTCRRRRTTCSAAPARRPSSTCSARTPVSAPVAPSADSPRQ